MLNTSYLNLNILLKDQISYAYYITLWTCLLGFLNFTFVSRFGYMSRAHDNRLDQRPLIKQLNAVLERNENIGYNVQGVMSLFE